MKTHPDKGEKILPGGGGIRQFPFAGGFLHASAHAVHDVRLVSVTVMEEQVFITAGNRLRSSGDYSQVLLQDKVLPEKLLHGGAGRRGEGEDHGAAGAGVQPVDRKGFPPSLLRDKVRKARGLGGDADGLLTDQQVFVAVKNGNLQGRSYPFEK